MPNTRSAGFGKSCLLYQAYKMLKCQSLRFYLFSCTFIIPPICQRSLEALVFFYRKSEEKKNTCTLICRFGLFVGGCFFFFFLCFLTSLLRLKGKSLKEVDQRVYKAEIKKQKRGKEMTPTPTFGK